MATDDAEDTARVGELRVRMRIPGASSRRTCLVKCALAFTAAAATVYFFFARPPEDCLKARDLAFHSEHLAREDTRCEAALLALEAYELNSTCGGDPDQPRIYEALHRTWKFFPSTPPTSECDSPPARCPSQPLLDLPSCLTGDQSETQYSTAPVRAVAFGPQGRWLAIGGEDGVLRRMDLDDPDHPIKRLAESADGFRSIAVNESHIAAGSDAGTIRVWVCDADAPFCEATPEWIAHPGVVSALAFRPGSPGQLVSAGLDGTVRKWDTASNEMEQLYPDEGSIPGPKVHSVAFSPDGKLVAVGTAHGTELWELDDPSVRRTLDPETDVRAVAFGASGRFRFLASGSYDGDVAVWHWNAAEDLAFLECDRDGCPAPASLPGHESSVNALGFDAAEGGLRLASGSSDGNVKIWKFTNAWDPLPLVLSGHESWIWTLAFRPPPHNDQLVTGSEDDTVRVWTTRAGCFYEEMKTIVECECLDASETAAELAESRGVATRDEG